MSKVIGRGRERLLGYLLGVPIVMHLPDHHVDEDSVEKLKTRNDIATLRRLVKAGDREIMRNDVCRKIVGELFSKTDVKELIMGIPPFYIIDEDKCSLAATHAINDSLELMTNIERSYRRVSVKVSLMEKISYSKGKQALQYHLYACTNSECPKTCLFECPTRHAREGEYEEAIKFWRYRPIEVLRSSKEVDNKIEEGIKRGDEKNTIKSVVEEILPVL